jgi:hypothetical protein
MPQQYELQQQRRHHGWIKRRLAAFAAVSAGDLGEVDFVPHHAQHKAGKMVRRHEVPTIAGNNSRSSIFQGRNVLLMRSDRIAGPGRGAATLTLPVSSRRHRQ